MNRTENWRFKMVWSRVGVGFTQHIQEGDHIGPTMLQELQTLLLVGLLVSTYFLTIGCRQIGASLPAESGNISDKVAGATEVLDDIADLLNEALQSVGAMGSPQTPSSPVEMILSTLMSSMASKANHGPQENERTIHEINPTPTHETED